MALLFADSFDHYVTADLAKKGWVLAGVSTIAAVGRRGTNGLVHPSSSSSITRSFVPTTDTVVVGFSYAINGAICAFSLVADAGATTHLSFTVLPDGSMAAYRGAQTTLLGTAPPGSLIVGATNYIEVKAKLSDTTGLIEVRANGGSSPIINLTGIDTKNGGTATVFGGWRFGGYTVAYASANVDDFYILDTSGATNNDFLGDVRVDCIFPTSDGTYSQFTPSTPGPHWSLVDETTPNTTDYVDGTALNQIDSYGMQDVSTLASSTVYGVQVNLAALKDDAGPRSLSGMVRTSGTDAVAPASTLATTQAYVTQVFETDAGGSAWTQTSVNAMEAGAKVTV